MLPVIELHPEHFREEQSSIQIIARTQPDHANAIEHKCLTAHIS